MKEGNFMLQPYEYNFIKKEITHLIDIYKTVNDKDTIMTSQAIVKNNIYPLLGAELYEAIRVDYLDIRLTNAKAEKIFTRIKNDVIPFQTPSEKQIEKAFRKVKKLKYPRLETFDLQETNYLAWDDIGTSRKYLTYMNEGKFTGIYGTMSTNVIKNVCAICNKIDNVAMFMTTTKTSGDGTYTKKGNYICKDSEKCNCQMETMTHFHTFYQTVSK